MSEIRHKDRILEAIDQLRKRKARPDVNRICSFMFRRFAVNCIETKLDLQKLIDAEIVIKVDYKGSTSYRNASKWAMLPSYKYKKEIDTSSLISSAVAELIVLEPDYLDIGVPEFELEAHMIQKDSRRFSKKNLENILKKEVEQRTLVKLDNGNYFLGEHSSSTMDRPSASRVGSPGKNSAKQKQSLASCRQVQRQRKPKFVDKHNDNSNDSDRMKPEDQSNSSEGANVGFRVGGRQKRARIVFDPSDNNLPTRVNKKRGPGRPLGSLNKSTIQCNNSTSSSSNSAHSTPTTTTTAPPSQTKSTSTPTPPLQRVNAGTQVRPFNKLLTESSSPSTNPSLCVVCHSYGTRVKGVPERLITCSDCTTKAHPSCIENNEGYTQNGWLCAKCNNKFCVVCELKVKDPTARAICINCQDCYHIQCHTPSVPERVRIKQIPWLCCKCFDSPTSQQPPTPALPPPPPQPIVRPKEPAVRDTAVSTPVVKEKDQSLSPPKKELVPEPPPPIPEAKPRNVPANCLQDPFEDIPIDESIPDAKHWTVNQVYQYFSTQLKPEWAQPFKEQDIDGQSLLLMKRMDVLTGLNLKLGPALKVYGHIRKLQTRKSHLRILWS